MAMMEGEHVASLWDKLEDESDEMCKAWMDAFNGYNKGIGMALGKLREQPQDIQGRDAEIAMLHAVLERPKTPVALLLGQAGVGKTALVEEFAKQLNSGSYHTMTDSKYLLVALRLGQLSSLGNAKLQATLSSLLDDMKTLEEGAQIALGDERVKIVLFIDEVHMLVTIFGPGTKVGGDVLKDVLARAPIRVIAATTRREYDSTIAVDKPLAERFKQIEISELAPKVVEKVALDWWRKVVPDCPPVDPALVRSAIEANRAYRSDSAEPRKTIDILEDLASYCKRTGRSADRHELERIFRDRYSIALSFKVDADEVYGEVERRIKGQPFALYELKRLVRSLVYQLDPTSNKPRLTALFTGPTGVGKTETVKAISSTLYPGEEVMLNINCPDYKTPEYEPAFRKRLGEFVRHTPNAIVLLDEFEKAHESVRDSMLTILDEGIVTFDTLNREGYSEVNSISLRNTIVIATTNAGADVFANDARFSQRNSRLQDEMGSVTKEEVEQLMAALLPNLQANGFKPEMLGRFSRIIPYRSLSAGTLLKIAEREVESLIAKFKAARGIEIIMEEPHQWPKAAYDYVTTDVALYIAFIRCDAANSNAGGARGIRREVESAVYDTIVDAIVDNPEASKFRMRVSETSAIYSYGASSTEGGIIIEPIA